MKLLTFLTFLTLPIFAQDGNFWGKWMTNCIKEDQFYYQGKLLLEKGSFTFTGYVNTDPECHVVGAELSARGTFWNDQLKTGDLDFDFESMDLRPTTPSMAMGMNLYKVCGRSDWKANKSVSVLGENCFGIRVPRAEELQYNIYAFMRKEKLLFGRLTRELDGSSPSRRPQDLASEYPLQRVRVMETQ